MKNQRHKAHWLSAISKISLIVTLLMTATCVAVVEWSPETNLTTDLAWDRVPSIMQTRNGTIWVAWSSDRIYLQYDIFYAVSSDYGSTWSDPPTRFTRHTGTDETPYIMQTQNGSIWIVWSSDRTGNAELLYRKTLSDGLYWSPIVQLTNNTYTDLFPSLTQNIDGTIWLVWHSNVDGNYDIYYKTSSDYGATWSGNTRLTTNSSWDLRPSITHTYNGTIWVAWSSYRTGDYEIFYKTSSNNGLTWSDATRLTTNTASDITPAVLQAADGPMWVFWASDRDAGQKDVFYKTSLDYGSNWSDATKLDGMSNYDDGTPAVTNTNERRIWVAWHSLRTGDFEIFYTISNEMTPIHDVAIVNIIPWRPPGVKVTSAPRGTPIYVNVTVENQGTFEETFNVATYADRITNDVRINIGNQSLSLTNGAATTLTFTWDTTETPSGSYYISANATTVPGEYDTADNILLHGAYIGGIFPLGTQPEVNLLAKFFPLALTLLIVAASGLGAIFFFKRLMSIKPR